MRGREEARARFGRPHDGLGVLEASETKRRWRAERYGETERTERVHVVRVRVAHEGVHGGKVGARDAGVEDGVVLEHADGAVDAVGRRARGAWLPWTRSWPECVTHAGLAQRR